MHDKSAHHYVGSFNNLNQHRDTLAGDRQSFEVDAWLDLRAEPMLLRIPRNGSDNSIIKILDLFGETVGFIRASDVGEEGGNYLVVGGQWQRSGPPAGLAQSPDTGTHEYLYSSLTAVRRAHIVVPSPPALNRPAPRLPAPRKLPQFARFDPCIAGFLPRLRLLVVVYYT